MKKTGFISIILASILTLEVNAQQQVTVEVYPTISKAINGEKVLDRKKYFNLAANVNEVAKDLNDERLNYYFKDLKMSIGRKLSVVRSEVKWGNNVREDASRPGWADLAYLEQKSDPSDDNISDELKEILGSRQGLAAHDGHNSYPNFMEQYTFDDAHDQYFPVNNDAAAELAANVLKYAYTDFQRPSYFELVNEPHWRFWGDQRFIDHHVKTKRKVTEMGLDVEVGGPCYSVGNFYKKEYDNLSQFTNFIDKTNFELDFYSFHTYDYMKWSDEDNDFIGAVSSGLPEEGVFDAIAAHTYNKFGKEFTFVGSEHGGYIPDEENREYAFNKISGEHFPGSGFQHEMQKRTIDNFIMVNSAISNTLTFMNHPHIIKKTVPFILLQSANWDPTYYSSLLVKENFDKDSDTFHEARLIDYYRFFSGVRGRRVVSHCNDTDIQHFAFVDKDQLILVFHNQSNVAGTINLNINDAWISKGNKSIRRLSRGSDFRPDFSEEKLNATTGITISGQESIVVFIDYLEEVREREIVNEVPYYSKETGTKFTGSKTFTVDIPDHSTARYATLRIGLSRSVDNGKEVDITFNGQKLNVPVEDCADRISGDSDYATTKIVRIDKSLLQTKNTIEVSFPDGKSGGVGAVVIRAALTLDNTPLGDLEVIEGKAMKVYPNPAAEIVQVKTGVKGIIELIGIDGKSVYNKAVQKADTVSVPLKGIVEGNYVIRFITSKGVKSSVLSIKR